MKLNDEVIDKTKKTIAVWFSCGAASSVAAKLIVEKYSKTHNILIVNNPVKEEHEDNRRFLNDVSKWIGKKIIESKSKEFPDASIITVFDKRKYISGIAGAPCTKFLKKQARYEFEVKNKIDFHVLGFTSDEIKRHERFVKNERENVMPILIDLDISKQDCFDILIKAGIKLPKIYSLGFPNANCIGCVKSQSPTYWNLVRKKFPKVYEQRAEQSRRIGCKLVVRKGERIFLDQLKETDKGGKIKSWDCGIFCDLDG
jgi:PP-loop superfamily ATP-utilizing enzyme